MNMNFASMNETCNNRRNEKEEKLMRSRLSIVFDMTKICPWKCPICAMCAEKSEASLKNELSIEEKLAFVEMLSSVNESRDVSIDFSGGEVLTNLDNLSVIEKAASVLGREKIGLSASGYRINATIAARLAGCVNDVEMTMDVVPGNDYKLRPKKYAEAAATAIPYLKEHGIAVGIQTVLANSNCTEENLKALYHYLCEKQVDNWSLLKFYPSGRGAEYPEEQLSPEKEAWVVKFIQKLDEMNPSTSKPEIDFHYTMPGHKKYSDECRCVRKSIGVMPDGTVTSCFWAVSESGEVDDKFNLGSLRENTLKEILEGEKAAYWLCGKHKCELS